MATILERKKKLLIITFVLFILSIGLFLFARNRVENQEIDYEEVKVTVISVEKERHGSAARGGTYYTYRVVVEYEGERYELINVQSGESIKYEALANLAPELQHDNPYFDNTVYYSNGKMYSNVAGIKTDSKLFNWQMVGLAAMCLCGAVHVMLLSDYFHKKKSFKDGK